MKIRIEIEDGIKEDELVIKCRELTSSIQKLQQYVLEQVSSVPKITFYKQAEEYYFSLEQVLFFETNQDRVYAHTKDDVYQIKYRLYELEEILPLEFTRVAKSTIINMKHIFSIKRNITAASLVRFHNSHKQVYVSRSYYKILKERLEERSLFS